MTALAGFWSFAGAEAAPACLRMLKSQSVYAPDDGALWDEGGISLGRRLSRILPEDVHDRRPVRGGEGRLVLVADVRLDNRGELASDLSLAPPDAAALSDAGLLMKSLERWGESAVERLVGDFAFALWDRESRRLLLARDFLGQRPLHFHRGVGFFAFASMPKGLHALPEIPYEVDRAEVAQFLAMIPETGSGTFFRGIEKVPPGHLVWAGPEGVESRRWWNPSLEPLRLKDSRDYAEAVRDALDASVAARLRGGNGRAGAHLSGGLDSAAIAATAARLLAAEGGKVVAFTSVPRPGYEGAGLRGAIADEGPLAAATASLYPNMEHVRISTGGRSPFDGLDRKFFLYERPFTNLCNAVWWEAINDSARERGLKVLLTGQSGNMSFSWTGMTLLPRLLRQGRLLRFCATSASLRRNGTRLGTIASQSLGPFLPNPLWRLVTRLRGRAGEPGEHGLAGPGSESSLRELARERGLDFARRPRSDGAAARLWALGRIDPGSFNKGTLGGWGLDVRDPAADRRLVELCLRIPDEQFLAGGVPRGLARSAFADRLPAAVTGERRKGYQSADWHEGVGAARDALAEEVERIAAAPAAAEALERPADASAGRRLAGAGLERHRLRPALQAGFAAWRRRRPFRPQSVRRQPLGSPARSRDGAASGGEPRPWRPGPPASAGRCPGRGRHIAPLHGRWRPPPWRAR